MSADALNVLVLLEADDAVRAGLQTAAPGAHITVHPVADDRSENLPPDLLHDVDCLLCELPPKNFHDFRRLKWMQLTSAGYSQVFGLPLVDQGIRVTNGRGNFDVPIAEWNLLMLLTWHRNLLSILDNQKRQLWDREARFQTELRGSVVGLYGYGGLARETARLCKSLGLTVRALTRDGTIAPRADVYSVPGTGDPDGRFCDQVFGPEHKLDFLSGLDYLILATPITRATTGMIGESELRALQQHAVLINPARAGLVDENALVRCLTEGWIRGASFDVHYAYPLPAGHRVWSLPNLILTPHISGSNLSPHFRERIFEIFSLNLARFAAEAALLNELTTAQLLGE